MESIDVSKKQTISSRHRKIKLYHVSNQRSVFHPYGPRRFWIKYRVFHNCWNKV